MTSPEGTVVASIRFQPVGKLYHFNATKIDDLKTGDYVIVSTSRGREMGQVAGLLSGKDSPKGSHKPVERRATARELVMGRIRDINPRVGIMIWETSVLMSVQS